MIFAMEKVKFLHGAGEVTLSGGRLVGVSVAIALPVENGCMVDRSCNQGTVFNISFRKDDEFQEKKKKNLKLDERNDSYRIIILTRMGGMGEERRMDGRREER